MTDAEYEARSDAYADQKEWGAQYFSDTDASRVNSFGYGSRAMENAIEWTIPMPLAVAAGEGPSSKLVYRVDGGEWITMPVDKPNVNHGERR